MTTIYRQVISLTCAFSAIVCLTASQIKDPVPPYKNPKLSTEKRIQDLLSRMTTEEKVGQLATLLGWEMYEKKGDSVAVSDKFKQAVGQQHIGMLWATLRADP